MKCTFCKTELPEGTGTMFVKKDGTTYYFCSSKCEKNMLKLKRKSASVKWANKNAISEEAVKSKKKA